MNRHPRSVARCFRVVHCVVASKGPCAQRFARILEGTASTERLQGQAGCGAVRIRERVFLRTPACQLPGAFLTRGSPDEDRDACWDPEVRPACHEETVWFQTVDELWLVSEIVEHFTLRTEGSQLYGCPSDRASAV